MSHLLPCSTCPWRIDQRADSIPFYVHRKACALVNTVGEGDAFRPIMACHYSAEDEPRACNGYVARAGWNNINVRILVMLGETAHPDLVAIACSEAGIKLHRSYRAVLAKLRRTRA